MCYFVGYLLLSVNSQLNVEFGNDNRTLESVQNINETEFVEVTTVIGIQNQNNESSTKGNIISNESEEEEEEKSSDENLKKILCSSDTVILMYKFYRISIPIFVRFIFGIAVNMTKVKAVFTNPIGIAIVLFSNFLIVPLVSDRFDFKHVELINHFLM